MRPIKIKFLLSLLLLITSSWLYANPIERVEPTFWWVGMNNPNLQLLVYGEDISSYHPSIDYPGVSLRQVIRVESPNYLFLDLVISDEAQAGTENIEFKNRGKVRFSHKYSLQSRDAGSANREGVDGSDAIYLITPDRFVNGDPSNDNVEGMRELADRSNPAMVGISRA